ncbi:RNA interference and silencing protein [Blastomyces dermatitidis ER-3]|uniref:RNA interference and silencing protein n=2 Tax=Ajellomyces dermatitidis (strain ER-3 / ATCC MYA-2586) TaxID=559297 RepID=A0ABP2ETM8_AJEDR|nr:RNA interference and silencing protein [Blastomyces dermatitidis ER-3]EEQ86115.1 RNA interference and silencing protein [Blastomyces dermatitidis ER-3]
MSGKPQRKGRGSARVDRGGGGGGRGGRDGGGQRHPIFGQTPDTPRNRREGVASGDAAQASAISCAGFSDLEIFSYQSHVPQPNSTVQSVENHVNTAVLALSSTSKEPKLPQRPTFGTQGNKVTLYANYFELAVKQDLSLYRYKIILDPDERGRLPIGRKAKQIIRLFLDQEFYKLSDKIASDFKSTIISSVELEPLQKLPYIVTYQAEDELEPAPNARMYTLKVTRTGTLQVSALVDYLSSTSANAVFGGKEEVIQALNVVMGYYPKDSEHIANVGTNKHFFIKPPDVEKWDLTGGLEVLRGFFGSVRAATARILLNVQISNVAVFAEGPLPRVMMSFFQSYGHSMGKLDRFLKSVRVQLTHMKKVGSDGREVLPIKTILGVATIDDGRGMKNKPRVQRVGAGPKDVTFYKEPNADDEMLGANTSSTAGAYVSVFEFFRDIRKITLENPDLPVVNIGSRERPIYLPPDVCIVLPGQAPNMTLSTTQTQQMIKFAVRRPALNAKSINTKGAQILGASQPANSTLAGFGLAVQPGLITVPGRVLQGPQVRYKSVGRDARPPTNPNSGSWNLQRNQFSVAKPLKNWACLWIQKRDTSLPWPDAETLSSQALDPFIRQLKQLGMTVDQPLIHICPDDFERSIEEHIASVLQFKPSLQLIFFILPVVSSIYSRIKYLCDVKWGVHSICVVAGKFAKERNCQYFSNVALKFNLKLGGTNHTLDPSKLGFISEGKTMVVGLDVTHPSPGSSSNAPSIAAIVASIDQDLTQWPADVRIQPSRQEMVSGLDELLKSRLRLWAKHHRTAYPENILVYRDGVSEGQYNTVLNEELPLLQKACRSLYPAQQTRRGLPRLSIIIVGKRHNTRFFASAPAAADRSFNPRNGTVVDRAVTDARNWDFFLQAHTALHGTARPGHYYLVYDEIFRSSVVKPSLARLTGGIGANVADAVEALTHNMCYLFGRATKSVSVCPPAYYADLVCTRARCYLSRLFEAGSAAGSVAAGSVAGGGRSMSSLEVGLAKLSTAMPQGGEGDGGNDQQEARVSEVRIHELVRDSMFYI